MSARTAALVLGKSGPTQNFSEARQPDATRTELIKATLGPTIVAARKDHILGDPTTVLQFIGCNENRLGFYTLPKMVVDAGGDTVVLAHFTDTIGEPYPVLISL